MPQNHWLNSKLLMDMENKELIQLAQDLLVRSNADRNSPFKTFVLSTAGTAADARMVVNRSFFANNWSVVFYTDSRSPKVEALKESPQVCSLFWHRKQSLQIRLYAKANLLSTGHPLYQEHLHKVKSSKSKQDYQTELPPGSVINAKDQVQYDKESLHLAVVLLESYKADILKLDREGHSRCLVYFDDGDKKHDKLIP